MEKSWHDYVSIHSTIEGARAAFEIDCALLLRAMHPDKAVKIVRANPGDEGIDIYIGDISSGSIEVYQCKFFLNSFGESQKGQIRESFKTAVESEEFTMDKWHLCMPLDDFDINDNKWWDAWKAKQELSSGATIHIMNGNEIKHNLKKFNLYNTVFRIEDSLKIEEMREGIKFLINLLAPKPEQLLKQSNIDEIIKKTAFSTLYEIGYRLSYEEFYTSRDSDDLFITSLTLPKNIWIYGLSGVGKTLTCKRNLTINRLNFIYIYLNSGSAPQSVKELLELVYDNLYSRYEEDLSGFLNNTNNLSRRIVKLLQKVVLENSTIICIDEFPAIDARLFGELTSHLMAICADFENSCNGNNNLKFIISTIKNPANFLINEKANDFFTFIEIPIWRQEQLASLLDKIYNKIGIILPIEQTKELLEKSSTPRVVKSLLYQVMMHHKSKDFDTLLKDVIDKN